MKLNYKCPACGKDEWIEHVRFFTNKGDEKIMFRCDCGHIYVVYADMVKAL